ncbi:FAD/NAD(P)-binding domain-containing protein [Xylona heveae TC161]|uniref:Kynurenine 3-monooxygenase n=1 Tax=Xylona heveae (strain CBS 132557 / TC161) TaxID=1328760 RepID=A0A165JH06_XYLHT|nr:FAD/NAD(P)-binding domain-containing protein [Xylona heveae TC161]KZF26229.1 FAD/NAD(P)-binding domain-containing protein [Xylona heveae TC161]
MAAETKTQKTVVVGAGPVGALAALYAARRGHEVEVYELRGDLRDPDTIPLNFTRSINLALSERGINAMRNAGSTSLLDGVLSETIPMHGRMIHGRTKTGDLFEQSQLYDVHGRFQRAVDRGSLNKSLLDELDHLPNVKLFFNHKLTGADFDANKAWFERRIPSSSPTKPSESETETETESSSETPATTSSSNPVPPAPPGPEEIQVEFDFLIGADGAHSATRYHLMKYTRVNYQQEYIDALWCEFQIPPLSQPSLPSSSSSSSSTSSSSPSASASGFRISPNHLHIWPGRDFMFIAIPSLDRSFTCTLFAPQDVFARLSSSLSSDPSDPSAFSSSSTPSHPSDPSGPSGSDLLTFFNTHFPGVVPDLISPDALRWQFSNNPHLPLISIKCTPYHYSSKVVIVGDAAHAMVPFYGQGMNAGLEDVRVLFDVLDSYSPGSSSLDKYSSDNMGAALSAYTRLRTPDAHAINDLALSNYIEMRASVRSPVYLLRKTIEEFISSRFPSTGWATQYARVCFGNERYSDVQHAVARQGRILAGGLVASALLGSSVLGVVLLRMIAMRGGRRVVGGGREWVTTLVRMLREKIGSLRR